MSSAHLAFSSDGHLPLTSMRLGIKGTIVGVRPSADARVERLLALGVAPGASVILLQRLPAVVFLCDQTEMAVEHAVAASIIVCVEAVVPGR